MIRMIAGRVSSELLKDSLWIHVPSHTAFRSMFGRLCMIFVRVDNVPNDITASF